jgi:hypothetical protein
VAAPFWRTSTAFEKMLEVAEDKIEKVEVQDEVSDVKCESAAP